MNQSYYLACITHRLVPSLGKQKINKKKPHKCENDLEYANSGILNYHTYPMFTFSQKTNICNGNNISVIFKMHLRPKLHASQFHFVSLQWHFPWRSSILRFRSWLQVEHCTAVRTWCQTTLALLKCEGKGLKHRALHQPSVTNKLCHAGERKLLCAQCSIQESEPEVHAPVHL